MDPKDLSGYCNILSLSIYVYIHLYKLDSLLLEHSMLPHAQVYPNILSTPPLKEAHRTARDIRSCPNPSATRTWWSLLKSQPVACSRNRCPVKPEKLKAPGSAKAPKTPDLTEFDSSEARRKGGPMRTAIHWSDCDGWNRENPVRASCLPLTGSG